MVIAFNTIIAVLCLTTFVLCLLTASILLLYSRGHRAVRYLGLYYLVFACIFIENGLIPNICWLLCMPLSWLYIRTTITEKPLSPWDGFQLLPVFIYLTAYFLPHAPQIPILSLQLTVYWILQARMLASHHLAASRNERLSLNWMTCFNYLQLTFFIPTFIEMAARIWPGISIPPIVPLTGVMLSAIILFFYPCILYSSKGTDTSAAGRTRRLLDHSSIRRLTAELEKIMLEKKPFLDPNYTLKDLANATDVPLYKLSAYMNQTTGANFSGYLNQWRIRYCLDLIQEKKTVNLNLHGIAEKCGFNNRNTFSSAFKKVTGKSPSVYLHSKA